MHLDRPVRIQLENAMRAGAIVPAALHYRMGDSDNGKLTDKNLRKYVVELEVFIAHDRLH
jgi:hypothetical protein